MPQAIAAAVVNFALAAGQVAVQTAVYQAAVAAVEVAIYAGVAAATKQNSKTKAQGGLINLELNPSAPRRLVVGKRALGGNLIDWYVAGSKNTKLYLPIYLSEGPCGTITKVFAGGRVVWDTPLVHGVRTVLPGFRSGGDRLWLTYYDGRVGQTADPTLVALGQGWTSANKMTGCAWVLAEMQWDSDNMRSPVALTFEHEGAKLYDRRKDSTAGGSGLHRLNDPSTWELGDAEGANPAVALDHFQLGRYWGGQRVFGIGLAPTDVPYARFAAQANICDENVALKAGGTQKRYRANGILSAADPYDDTIWRFCSAMAAEPADFGGRIGVVGVEARTPVLTIDDDDLIDGAGETYNPKRTWGELVGAVEGKYQDPAQLYQPVPYPEVTDAAWSTQDGGEPKRLTYDLEFETNNERAQRLALLKAKYERRQATLNGVYPFWAIELERGDWFLRTGRAGSRFGEAGKLFEVMDRILDPKTFLVSIPAKEVDPSDSAWSASVAKDPPPAPDDGTSTLSTVEVPAITVTAISLAGTASSVPALKIAFTTPTDPRVKWLYIEVENVDGTTPKVTKTVAIPADTNNVVFSDGIVDGDGYAVSAKYITDTIQSAWCVASIVYSSGTYAVGTAAAVAWSGVTGANKPADNATKNTTTVGPIAPTSPTNGDMWCDTSSTPYVWKLREAGAWSAVALNGSVFGSSVYEAGGGSVAALSAFKTALGIASGFTGQGALATLGSLAFGGAYLTGFGNLAARGDVYLGSSFVLETSGGAQVTLANFKTILGIASGFTGQAWGATAAQSAIDNALVAMGPNALVDSGFRLASTYWATSGFQVTPVATYVAESGLRKAKLTVTGSTPNNSSATVQGSTSNLFPCVAGDRIEASAYFGSAVWPTAQLYVYFFNAAGTQVGTNFIGSITLAGFDGTGDLSTFKRGGGFTTAPATAVSALIHARFVNLSGSAITSPIGAVTQPFLRKADAVQTALSPWALGFEAQLAADVTATNISSGFTGQGAFATLSSVAYGSGYLTGFGALAALSNGSTLTAGGFTGQGVLATLNTVTGKTLDIADPTNLCLDVNWDDTSLWVFSGGWATDTSTDVTSTLKAKRGIKITASGANPQTQGNAIYRNAPAYAVEPGVAYRLKVNVLVKAGFRGLLSIVQNWNDQAGGFISGSPVSGVDYRTTPAAVDTVATIDGLVTAPANAAFGCFYVACTWPGAAASAGVAFAAMPRVTRAVSYELLTSTAVRLGTNITRADGSTSLTDALAVTSLGVASGITSQGAFATLSSVAYGSGYLTGFGTVAALSSITGLTAGGITGQGALATLSSVTGQYLAAGVGANALVDTEFRYLSSYWRAVAQSGTVGVAVNTSTNGIRRLTLTGAGVTVGNYLQLDTLPQIASFPIAAGEWVEGSAFAGGSNLSRVQLFIDFRDAAGANTGFSSFPEDASPTAGGGELSTFERLFVIAQAPAGTVKAYLNVRGTASTAAPVLQVTKPLLARALQGQTEASPWKPGFDGELGANTTETRIASGFTGQGSLATISRANVVALSGSEVLNNALVPAGSNGLVDTGFRWQSTYWSKDSVTGTTAFSVLASTGGLRASVVTGAGLTANGSNYVRQHSNAQRAFFPCKPGDVVGARVLVGGDNLSLLQVLIAFRDAAGTAVGFSTATVLSSGILDGTGEETTFNEMTNIATAPAGTVTANIDIRGIASTSAPVTRIAKPTLAVLAAGQTVVPPYSPGREHEIGANVTETRTAAGFTGQAWGATAAQSLIDNALVSQGPNAIVDSGFRAPSLHWALAGYLNTPTVSYIDESQMRKARITGAASTPTGGTAQISSVLKNAIPVAAGERVEASAYFGAAASGWSTGQVYVDWYNASNTYLSSSFIGSTAMTGALGNGDLSTFSRVAGFATAPASSALARLSARFGNTTGGTLTSPVGTITLPLLRKADATQTAASPWSPGFDGVPGADITSANTASGITGQGGLATLNFVTIGSNLRLADGTTVATTAAVVTASGVASGIASQGSLATSNFVLFSSTVRLANGTTVVTDAMVVTSSGVASGIASQGSQATANAQRGSSYSGTPVEGSWWADTGVTPNKLKFYTGGAWQVVATLVPDALVGVLDATMTSDYVATHSANVTPTLNVSPQVSSIVNGTAPYTYKWAIVDMAQGAAPTITNGNTAQCTLTRSATLTAAASYEGTASCTITDANGKQRVKYFNFSDTSTI